MVTRSAAAYSSLQAHDKSIADARKAIEIDPTFSKAWSRLGHALFQSGEFSDAVDAYEKGLEIDPAVSPCSSRTVNVANEYATEQNYAILPRDRSFSTSYSQRRR